jgi:hypothetical protein
MKVELASHSVRSNLNQSSLQSLASAIESFGAIFASRASCAFSDLEAYIELLLEEENQYSKDIVRSLLDFADNLRNNSSSMDDSADTVNNRERQSRLRSYIFATKLNHKLLSVHTDLQDQYLADCSELFIEWERTLNLSSSNEGEEVCIGAFFSICIVFVNIVSHHERFIIVLVAKRIETW